MLKIISVFFVLGALIPSGAWANEGAGDHQCAECHKKEVETFLETRHAHGDNCSICHGDPTEHLRQGNATNSIINPGHLGLKKSNALCLNCHGEKNIDTHEKFRSVPNLHNQLNCLDCHIMHAGTPDTTEKFREDLTVDCRVCHQKNSDLFESSEHGFAGMTCTDCHKLHEQRTISQDIEEQINRCLFCHPSQDLEFHLPYTHPLRERQIKCSDCHNPHSSENHAMLKKPGDKVCTDCHRDILIEGGTHPVSQGTDHPFKKVKCLDCHRAHGSNFQKVLRYPLNHICQTCHE